MQVYYRELSCNGRIVGEQHLLSAGTVAEVSKDFCHQDGRRNICMYCQARPYTNQAYTTAVVLLIFY